MTDHNPKHEQAKEAAQAQAGASQEEGERRAAELKANQERAAQAKADEDARMAKESGTTTPENTKEQARPDTAAANAQDQAEKANASDKKAESKELDRELAASMDASDPPSSIQP